MKRLVSLCTALAAISLIALSCQSAAPAKESAPSAEAAVPEVPSTPATDADGNLLGQYGTVRLVVDRNIADQKDEELVLVAPQPVVVEWQGEKALKVMANDKKEIRFTWVFDEPIPADQFAGITYKIGGFNSYSNYNFAIIYDEKESASFFLGNSKKSEWSEITKKKTQAESWGKPWLSSKKIRAIQFWTNSAKEVYVKDFDFLKN